MALEPRRCRAVVAGLTLTLGLTACATPARMHTDAELAAVGRACGAAEGEVIQDAEEPKVLFFYSVAPPRSQIHCLAQWARHNHLHLAYIQGVDEQAQ